MRRFKIPGFAGKLLKEHILFFGLAIAGCGGMDSGMNSNRVLMSMTLSPATAEAHNFANGKVQFTATGTFSQPPSPAIVPFTEPYTGTWSVSSMNVATIDQNGMAQCVPGAAGTVTVSATVSSNSAGPGAMSTAVSARATLDCP
jgi:hypothetical protein